MTLTIKTSFQQGRPQVEFVDLFTSEPVLVWNYSSQGDYKDLFQKLLLLSCADAISKSDS